MSHLALSPVGEAVYALLSGDVEMTALVADRLFDDVPQPVTFPFVLYTVQERPVRGFGTGGLPECTLRVHVYSTYEGLKQAQAILQRAIALLRDATLTVTGYRSCGQVFYDESFVFPDQEIGGVKCHELAATFRIYVEEQ